MADTNPGSGLRMVPAPQGGGQYDPHIHEERLRVAARQPTTPAITDTKGEILLDVIARLKEEDARKPGRIAIPGFNFLRRPGDGAIVTGTVAIPAPVPGRELDWEDDFKNIYMRFASLKAAQEIFAHLHQSVPDIACGPATLRQSFPGSPDLDGSGVVIGIVDIGCDFKHRNFRRSTGSTRLLSIWDQSDPADGKESSPIDFKGGTFQGGREFTREQIDRALLQPDPYAALGYTPPIGAHGTHVMDIAAGNGLEPDLLDGRPGIGPVERAAAGVAPGADLIFVHLKTEKTQCLGNSRHLLEAVEYIFLKAEELKRPAVVNLSLSTTGGPHDGTTLVEMGFEALLNHPDGTPREGRAIVISAGNSFAKDGHIAGTVKPEAPVELSWRIDPRAPRDETLTPRNEMEVWYSGEKSLTVSLESPGSPSRPNLSLGPVKLGETYDLYDGGKRIGRISHRQDDPNNHDNQIDIRVTPLGAEGQPETWKVKLEAEIRPESETAARSRPGADQADLEDVPFHAWIEQDDQGLARFEGDTDSARTLGSIACGKSPIVVGAFDTFEDVLTHRPYEGTSAGPTRKGQQDKPDVSAPGVAILAARAQGGTTIMSGTSMAAPHVTGLVALLFQFATQTGGEFLPADVTRGLIINAAKRASKFAGGWDPQLGHGRVNGIATLEDLLKLHLKSKRPGDSESSLLESIGPEPTGPNSKDSGCYAKATKSNVLPLAKTGGSEPRPRPRRRQAAAK
jgi:subtilisin family serine protease